jgi:hypothetical protein
MGRSRVYCTPPANANWQHNTTAARSIPLVIALARSAGSLRRTARPSAYDRPFRIREANARSGHLGWGGDAADLVSNKLRGSRAVGM